jgi:SOS response regulatory protein OraA/RecX
MDPITMTLAVQVVAILLPFVKKGTDEFVSEIGQAAGQEAASKVKKLLNTLKTRWKTDKEASNGLNKFEEKPERYQPMLEDILKEKLSEDKDFAAELRQIVDSLGPSLKAIQKMDIGKDVTGVDIGEAKTGNIDVDQYIKEGTNVIGVKINKFG